MKFRDNIFTATKGLSMHKSRAILTVLGIVIGISSIILIMSIGQGARNLIVGEIQTLGPENIVILPGRPPRGPSDFAGTLFSDSLKIKDLEDIKNKANVPEAVDVNPIVFTTVNASYQGGVSEIIILGVAPSTFETFDLTFKSGTAFDNSDVLQKSEVVVLGHKVYTDLFGESDAVGQKIKVKGKNLKVIGVLAKKGQASFLNFDEHIIAPYTMVQQYIAGTRYFNRISVKAESVEAIPGVIKDIQRILRNNHNISDPQNDDFQILTQDDLVKSVSTITDILTLLLTAVAAISLIVGGVGIMNIMLVSVTERTREIGLRKALGATKRDILRQFLTEAMILTFSGGILGIILGTVSEFGISFAFNKFSDLNFPFTFSVTGAVLGLIVSSAIGLAFGIFPARQAAKKSPIEALRYE